MSPEVSPEARSPRAAQVRGTNRYGLRIAGVRLAFPAGEVLEYLTDATIHPLPLAPRRLVGLLQLRGHPVAVFDAGSASALRPGQRRPVLVVGEPARAAALLVDEPPMAIAEDVAQTSDIAADWDGSPADRVFECAVGEALRDVDGLAWWPVDPARLFEALAADEPALEACAGGARTGAR